MTNLFWLIKFGRKEHLNKGQMRFGSIKEFESSTKNERGDKFEGAINIVNGQFSKIEYDHPDLGKGSFKPAQDTRGTITNFTDDPYFCFSSYALTSDCFKEDSYEIDKRMLDFGEYALVIKEPILFFNHVKNKLNNLGIEYSYKLIHYKDYKQEGKITTNLFSKTDDLSHQFEHRTLIRTKTKKEEVFIEVGSIEEFLFFIQGGRNDSNSVYCKEK